jgi:hypothetical protein
VHVEVDRRSALMLSMRARAVSSFVAIYPELGCMFVRVAFYRARRLYITKKTGAL